MHTIQYTDALCDCRTASTIQKATGVTDVYLVTMVTHVLALNLTAEDACVLLAYQATSELTSFTVLIVLPESIVYISTASYNRLKVQTNSVFYYAT